MSNRPEICHTLSQARCPLCSLPRELGLGRLLGAPGLGSRLGSHLLCAEAEHRRLGLGLGLWLGLHLLRAEAERWLLFELCGGRGLSCLARLLCAAEEVGEDVCQVEAAGLGLPRDGHALVDRHEGSAYRHLGQHQRRARLELSGHARLQARLAQTQEARLYRRAVGRVQVGDLQLAVAIDLQARVQAADVGIVNHDVRLVGRAHDDAATRRHRNFAALDRRRAQHPLLRHHRLRLPLSGRGRLADR
mmetsp:Transcript_16523/g.51373  ORF Transcript_16523/g.51373 Transcript_16523/m.51373 type:complete len:247 (+) Transcript_16523:2137-2877(+)